MAGGVGGGMGRLLGLGFVFGARDNGAVRTTDSIAEGMDRISDSVNEAGRASTSLGRLGAAIGALSLGQLDRIGDSLEGLADRAGINATDTGIESFGAEFSNTWRRATVGLGPFREEVEAMRGQISGLAYSMDIDANEMIAAVTGIARSGNSLDDFGIDLRAVAGSIQANILSGEQLASLLGGLSEGYELGADGASRLVDRVTAIGEAFGFGADAVRRLPEVISAADPILARFSDMSIEDVTESVTRLSVAMARGLNMSFEDATRASTELFTALSESRGQLTDLVTGVGSDFPELATELGIATGDIDEAMQSILSDPVTFAARMRDLMGTMDRSSPAFARLQGSLANLPEGFRFLITGGDEVGQALTDAMAPIGEFEGAFNRMARSGAGTSRTFSESMERLRDAFETRLHGMTSITTREVLGRQRAAYERMGNYLEDWSGRGGALGFLTQGFLNVRRYGLVHGLLPMLEDRLANAFPGISNQIETFAPLLSDLGSGFIDLATSMGPFLLVLSQLGVGGMLSRVFGTLSAGMGSVTAFLGPWGLLIAGVTAAGAAIYYFRDDISAFFDGTDWSGMASTVATGVLDGLSAISGLAEQAGALIDSIDWHALGEDIGKGVRQAWLVVSGLFSGEFNGDFQQFFVDAFGMEPSELGGIFLDTITDVLTNTVGRIPGIARDLLGGLLGDDSLVFTIFDSLFSMGESMDHIWKDIFGESSGDTFDTMIEGAGWALDWLVWMFEDYIDWVSSIFETVGDVWTDIIVPMADITWEILGEVGGAFSDLWEETVAPILGELRDWWVDEFGGEVMPQAQDSVHETGDSFRRMWRNLIRPALYDLLRTTLRVMNEINRFTMAVWRNIGRAAVLQISNIIIAIRSMRTNFETARDVLAAGWALIGARIRRFFTEPILQAGNIFMTIFENIELSVSTLRLGFLNIVRSLVSGIQTAFNAIPAPLRAAMGLVSDGLSQAVDSINREVTNEEQRITSQRQAIEAARREREADQAALAAETARAESEYAASLLERRRRLASEQREGIQTRNHLIEGIDRFGERTDAAFARASERIDELDAGVTNLGDAAEEVTASVSDSERPMGRVREDTGSDAPVTARTADREDSGPNRRASESPRERSRARREAQAAAEEAQGQERARDIAREMVISAFGPEAVRQLAASLGGGGRGRIVRSRGPSAGGTGEEMGG